ncbi:MAG: PAS domain-containing hybrid sensor histidine kinase/response regulator, partial [Anaerolineae bacterium]
ADGPHTFVELDTLTANFRRMSEAIQIRQAALRESEAKYRSLIEQSADAVYLLYEGKFEVINPKFEELFGITSEEARATDFDFLSLVAPQSQSIIAERVQKQEKGEELSPRYEFTALDKEGREIEVEVSVSYVPYHGGTATQGVLRDITARKRMEEKLREREERYRTLVENVPIGVYRNTPGPTGKFLTANPTFLQIFGFDSEEELKAINVSDLYVNPKDRKAFSDRLLAEGHVTGLELQLRKQDGTPIWTSVTARVTHDEMQGLTYFDCTIENITVRKQIEAEREELLARIRRQAQQVRQIINTVPEGVLVIDAEGRVVQANPVAESALEVLASAKKGDIITRLGNRPLYELLTSPPTSGLWHEVEANKRIFEVIARSVHNGSDPETWVLVVRDVTREREIERQARQQERLAAVGQLAAGIAHDFNNILATIVLYTQMISGTEELSARNRKQLATINDQAKQATQLIQQILDFSRRAVIERRPLDLLSLLQEQVQLLERTLSENIQIHLAYEEDEYIINADPGRIQQALTNLALNARDAMSKGGTLRLALQRITVIPGQQLSLPPELKPGDWIQLIVSDTGEGILPRDLPHLFEPFFTTKEPGRGSGLGLAQVHGIVRQHGGHIDVDTQVGAGTTFNIYLPALTSKPPEALSSELPDLIKGRGQTILVVEDNVGTRDALVASLRSLGYRVTKAANGEEALGMLAGMQVELVLSDVVMPKMGGKALLHALREQGIDVPVILLTGHPLMEELEALREVGLDDWLSKPISLVELAEAVNRALNR